MTLPEPDNDWDKPWVFGQMMKRAQGRCLNVAESERLLGYADSYQAYREMAADLVGLDLWMIMESWERSAARSAALTRHLVRRSSRTR